MKVFVTGTRGVPNIPGGVESHCEKLYPLIVKEGIEVKISRRSPYVKEKLAHWNGIELVDMFTPKKKSFEAIIHTALAIIEAKKWKADVVHVHAVGPALMIPLARLLGLKVVFTNHGPDYDRDKWGKLAKLILKLGEKLGGLFSNQVIVISNVIKDIIKRRCNKESNLIYNGVEIKEKTLDDSYVKTLNLESKGYALAVARFVPEKGLHDLINAFAKSNVNKKLVIAGDSDHEDTYSVELKQLAKNTPNVVLTGFITGDDLHQIFSHADLFVLPSYHEGLPISLLEAMSYGIQPLVSNIPANLEVGLPEQCYFECKNVSDLTSKLEYSVNKNRIENCESTFTNWVKEKYNWNDIALQTIEVYKNVVAGHK